jgi:hypothetical protein
MRLVGGAGCFAAALSTGSGESALRNGLLPHVPDRRPILMPRRAIDSNLFRRHDHESSEDLSGGIERGRRNPSRLVMARIAEALRVPLPKLLTPD